MLVKSRLNIVRGSSRDDVPPGRGPLGMAQGRDTEQPNRDGTASVKQASRTAWIGEC
jgi:hypothetical protein